MAYHSAHVNAYSADRSKEALVAHDDYESAIDGVKLFQIERFNHGSFVQLSFSERNSGGTKRSHTRTISVDVSIQALEAIIDHLKHGLQSANAVEAQPANDSQEAHQNKETERR